MGKAKNLFLALLAKFTATYEIFKIRAEIQNKKKKSVIISDLTFQT